MTRVFKQYEIKTKTEQKQCLQLKMLLLLGYNLNIVVQWVGSGGVKVWGNGDFLGGGEWANFWLMGRTHPHPPSMENPVMWYFWVYMIHHNCLYDSAKIACFVKIFLKLYTKMLSVNQHCKIFEVLISQKLFEV